MFTEPSYAGFLYKEYIFCWSTYDKAFKAAQVLGVDPHKVTTVGVWYPEVTS